MLVITPLIYFNGIFLLTMQISNFATSGSLVSNPSKLKAALLVTLAMAVSFGWFASNMVNVQQLSIAESSVSTISNSVTYIGTNAISFVASSSTASFAKIGQFYFGELILASVLVPVVIYIASSTFPGAISAASNANESGWSATNKTLWNNVFPLMAVVSAILLPISWIILPFAGRVGGSGMI